MSFDDPDHHDLLEAATDLLDSDPSDDGPGFATQDPFAAIVPILLIGLAAIAIRFIYMLVFESLP